MSNVEWLGHYRYVNFMFSFSFFLLTQHQGPTYKREDLCRLPAPATPAPLLNEQEGTLSPSPSHHGLPSPLNKRRGLHCPPIPTSTSSALQLSARGFHHHHPLCSPNSYEGSL